MKWVGWAALAFCICAHAQERGSLSPGILSLGAGVHYSQGNYGTDTTTRITALAFTARYDTERWIFRGTVPYLFISGSDAVVPGFGRVGATSGGESSASGLGDVTLSATYAAYYDAKAQFGVDVTGKAKLATADERERLGTGEHDVGIAAEAYKGFGRVTVFAGLGYTVFGDAPSFAFKNGFNYTLGASYRLDERDSVGVSFDERDRLANGVPAQDEITFFFSRRIEGGARAQAYLLLGFADGSPDWGAGVSAAFPF